MVVKGNSDNVIEYDVFFWTASLILIHSKYAIIDSLILNNIQKLWERGFRRIQYLKKSYTTGWLHKDTHEGQQNKYGDLTIY